MPNGLSEFCGINLHNLCFGEADKLPVSHRVFHTVLEDLQSLVEVFCTDKDLRDGALFGGSLFVNCKIENSEGDFLKNAGRKKLVIRVLKDYSNFASQFKKTFPVV